MEKNEIEVLIYGGSGTENPAYRYRVIHLKEQFDIAGIKCQILRSLAEIFQLTDTKNKILILHRVAWDSEVSKVKKFAEENFIPLVYDIDDYVFEPSIIPTIRGVDVLTEQQKNEYFKTVTHYREALTKCNFAIASTNYLKKRIQELGIEAFTHRNSLMMEIVELSKEISKKKKNSDEIVLGYFSGTYTHNHDFMECAEAVRSILNEFHNVTLLIVGPLDLPSNFNEFKNRIKREDVVDWKKLPNLMAKADINLAPLETNNNFSEAKSELKFFEAGIVKVPTIASKTDSYSDAIKNFENGFVAKNSKEWYEFLKLMIEDEKLRERLATNSLNNIKKKYTNEARAKDAKTLIENIVNRYTESKKDFQSNEHLDTDKKSSKRSLSISWVIPTPKPHQGGLRIIIRNCRYLAKFGHQVTVYVDPGTKFHNDDEIKQFFQKYYGETNFSVRKGYDIDDCDILIATFWPTAYLVKESPKAKKKVYFVQDFEPYFYQSGSEYVLAENTYRLGLYHVTVFPWLQPMIQDQFNGKATYILPPIERNYYKLPEKKSKNKKPQILFYGRPDQPRRCYDLGIQALQLVYERIKDIEIIIFGSDDIDGSQIPFSHKNKKTITSQEKLASLYQNANLGIIFNTTNPSLLSFEMMACGCPVVDLDLKSNRYNYGSKKNAALCEPTASGIAHKIIELINDPNKLEELGKNGYNYIKKFPDEEYSVKNFENILFSIYDDKFNGELTMPEPSDENYGSKIDEEQLKNKSNEDLFNLLLKLISNKMEKIETDLDTLTDSFVTTKTQLNNLDNRIYSISKKFPYNIAVKIMKKFSKEEK